MRVFLVAILISSSNLAFSQSFGLRLITDISQEEEINWSTGIGGYLGFSDSVHAFEGLLSCDWSWNETIVYDCLQCSEINASSTYKKISIGIGGLWRFPIKTKLNFKIGPAANYVFSEASYQGLVANWIMQFNSDYVGLGLISNFEIVDLLSSRINLDLFIHPSYLFIVNHTENDSMNSLYTQNQLLLSLQLGLSYTIEKN